jgi:ribosomal protein S18 acetylase RimI-like enzyme
MANRRATEADLDDLIEMYADLYAGLRRVGLPFELEDSDRLRDILSTQMRSKLCAVFVAEQEGERVGFISVMLGKMERRLKGDLIGAVNDLYVKPEARGGGVASGLVREAEVWFVSLGAGAVEADVIWGNELGRSFWRRQGYGDMSVSIYKPLPGADQ